MATIRELAEAIGLAAEDLEGLAGLESERLGELLARVRHAVEVEDQLVETSLTKALAAIPRPLRGRARALLLEES